MGKFTSKNTSWICYLSCFFLQACLWTLLNYQLFKAWLMLWIWNVFRVTAEKQGWCADPHLPPCAAYDFYHHLDSFFNILIHIVTSWTFGIIVWNVVLVNIFFSWHLYLFVLQSAVFRISFNTNKREPADIWWYDLLFQFCGNYGPSLF